MATVQARDGAQFSRLVRDAGAMAAEALQAGLPETNPCSAHLRVPRKGPEHSAPRDGAKNLRLWLVLPQLSG